MDSPERKLARKTRCKRAKQLYKVCRELNQQAGRVVYNVDHIVDVCNGGRDEWENLWIVPADWNHRAMTPKSPELVWAIKSLVQKSGRFFPKIPVAIARLEYMEMFKRYELTIQRDLPKYQIGSSIAFEIFQRELGISLEEWCSRECVG